MAKCMRTMIYSKEIEMKRYGLIALFSAITISLGFANPVQADGIIIPEPPPIPLPTPISQLAIRYHQVEVVIEDQIAMTRVDQVFYNPNDWQVEGTYLFPLPQGATVTEFSLWIDGEAVQGEVLDAEQARATYEEIVREMKDPALLEYVGQGAVQASIFPIPPYGERQIELAYSEVLTADNGLVKYVYPLNTEKFSVEPLEQVSVSVEVRSQEPIRAVYSPTHPIGTQRISDHMMRVGYEDSFVTPDKDFGLYYSIGEAEALHLLSARDPSEGEGADGFFLLMLAPRPEATAERLAKDVLLVLDKSGSMEGEKFRQAQTALKYVLEHLNPEDRFNVISFSTGVQGYANSLRPAEEAKEATAWVEQQTAMGSTDINRALLEAAGMAGGERPTYVIFLTDGLPTEGVTESQLILDNLEAAAKDNLRLFAFGVGYDVDTFLLDSLAGAHHGSSSYVLPGERLDETLSAFYEKVSTPVLMDLSLDFGDLAVYDLYPNPLPDLFSGSQIVVVGRYRRGGEETVTLSGYVNDERQTFRFEGQQFAEDSRGGSKLLDTLPRLWATRKIGYLLNQIRLNGPDEETIDQIVRLSIRYGIVTPYTSYLVTEPLPLGEAAQSRIAEETYADMAAEPAAPTSGQEAVEKAAEQGAMAEAEALETGPSVIEGVEVANLVRNAGAHTFVYVEGVWIDTAYDPEQTDTVKVAFLSEDYFALAAARPELAAAFALGERVIALADGVAYEVVSSGDEADSFKVPAGYEQSQGGSSGDVSNNPSEDIWGSWQSEVEDISEQIICFNSWLALSLLPLVVILRQRK